MATNVCNITAEQLFQMPADGKRYELVRGELRVMSPAGGRHGRVAHNLSFFLGGHVRAQALGLVYVAETGFLIARNPDTVRAPDVGFVSRSKSGQITDEAGYVPFAPDLAGEVISPSDSFSEVEEKALMWLRAGTRLVLLVDPGTRTVHVYRAADNIVVLDENDVLEAGDVVPDWRVAVRDLFA